MPHFCYRNLNRKGVVWSAKNTKTGLVEFRENTLFLKNTKFKVSEAGRKRVLKQKKKNVHAGVVGDIMKSAPKSQTWVRASYDPYKWTCFGFARGTERVDIFESKYAILNRNGLWVSNDSNVDGGLSLKEINSTK